MVHGDRGEFKVVVDGETVSEAGPWGRLGFLPSGRKIVAAVRARLASPVGGGSA
jgi:hypothetical protein